MTATPEEVVRIARDIERLRREQLKSFAELASAVATQNRCRELGVDEDQIVSRGFDRHLLPPGDWAEAVRLVDRMRIMTPPKCKTPEWGWVGPWLHGGGPARWYNHLKLKDGTVVYLSPMIAGPAVYLEQILAKEPEATEKEEDDHA